MRLHSVWLTSKASRRVPTEYFVLANLREQGTIIGRLAGHPIADTVVDARGRRYQFVGVAPRDRTGRFDVEALRTGEWIVQPGLIYAADGKASPSKPPRRGRGLHRS
ncbi:hypothetical protein [Mesorhizobium sp. NZP2077]|uniref:hypothetical protein n=1 Tax=Mesorhizobium sp. NZP2077 TaxID=2483404 RepID=UPI001557A061|nr:hypothetical protein [Mesorhizobium sp. NZP2077]QKC80612.1 hypothetical protein EB232_02160 [Mesorhizobium sp. NZP2077]QKD14004.1 hypothetical protein HGP13_02155 [Mesorhizobium sp. NZP2077]